MKKKLTWHTETRKVDDLLPDTINPRSMTDKQMNKLKKSLRKFNLVEIPAVDVDGKIVAGHQRVRALQLLGRGEEQIEVRVPDRRLTKDEYEQYLITSNAVTGDWDFDKLKSFDLDMLTDIGFDKNELASIWDEHLEVEDDEFDEEKELKKIRKTDIQRGDMFALGKHRLICGDAQDQSVVDRLMGKVKVDFVDVDPPYNIGLSYDKGVGNKANYGGTTNDSKSEKDYGIFIQKLMMNAVSAAKRDAHFIFWCDENWVWQFQILYRIVGINLKRLLVWIKNNASPTPGSAFNKITEFAVYGTKGSPFLSKDVKNLNEIVNKEFTTGNSLSEEILDQLNIWMVKRLPSKDYNHPTQKNPSLHQKALRRCTRPGDAVLDLTAGSGSILLACEQLKRVAYLCEYEPIFCQLIINRFENQTGIKAKKIE